VEKSDSRFSFGTVNCPQCTDGRLAIRKNKTTGDTFLGCTNFKAQGCRYSETYEELPAHLVEENNQLWVENEKLVELIADLRRKLAS